MAWWHHTAKSNWVNIGSGNQVMATNVDLSSTRLVGIYLRTLNDWSQVKYKYLVHVFSTWYALNCIRHFEIRKYMVFTCTWKQKHLILVPSTSSTFIKLTKTGLNVIQQSITKHHNLNYWNGSCVSWQHGVWSLDIRNELRRNPNYDIWDSPKYH